MDVCRKLLPRIRGRIGEIRREGGKVLERGKKFFFVVPPLPPPGKGSQLQCKWRCEMVKDRLGKWSSSSTPRRCDWSGVGKKK